MGRFTGVLGLLTMLALAWGFSTNRKAIRWRTVFWGLGLQLLFAFIVLDFTWGQRILGAAGAAVTKLLSYAYYGSSFVFGELGRQHSSFGSIFAFQVLPTIIFISAFFAVLYHLGVMQWLIQIFARLMQLTLRVSGAESLNVAASIFMGQTEAPLTIRPFLPGATQSELMTIMTSGMAHVSGGIMAAYILYGIEAQHLLAAVIMTAPGTILVSKMLVPETEIPATQGTIHMPKEAEHQEENLLGAIARGTIDGGRLALNVAIMLISFIALIALTNGMLGGLHNWLGTHHVPFPSKLDSILGAIFAPIAWLIGVPWHDAKIVGNLLGTRMVINEVVAYSMLGTQKAMMDFRSFTIATFALCGFANLSSIGIQIGGIGALAPNRRNDLARLGLRAMLAGTMANLMSASIVGILMR
ncbi:NupC/NupG family nucleoside CNT transporter [Pseudacidobacterium ailaaui]|uniref:NupC/NupG family nucleoside CNT transporter n=1 Tax=Pseudacidobacterium ailaaui TaxID=1382359 RepID=UPI00047D0DE6|nr:nucleoside transporter C-terminal domain-containing protein [Pseudacidobacterium ailaaui]MBX6358645.1 NupC/NupG family nucleoside CNT transporter [Pseudacidobacterium ailaaui]MCL6464455.1 NupC/NupG family nucleoside CNT transporter [Pseudacidobacterium ailaaui]MDI3255002.1 nucleoside transporter C-terminal domain-containing protein [Bacillota bacterium]